MTRQEDHMYRYKIKAKKGFTLSSPYLDLKK